MLHTPFSSRYDPACTALSAREIRREPIHAEGERDLAAVVQVVLEHVPDDPRARKLDALAVPVVGEGLPHVGGTPAGKAISHELPGVVERLRQLGAEGTRRSCRPYRLVPACIRAQRLAAILAQELGEPVHAAADDVQGILADGA